MRIKFKYEVIFMKRNLLVLTIAFLCSTLIFAGISMIFGASLFTAFCKLTDGWIFGVLFMCAYDMLSRAFKGEKFTKTYIAMMILFFANVVLFSFASSTDDQTRAVVGLCLSLFTGVCAIILPFLIHFIEGRRDSNNNGTGNIDADTMQKEWAKLRKHVLKMSKEKATEVLKEKLAFRLVGDSIYGALDLTRGMVTVNDTAMTFEAGLKNSVNPLVLEEADQYIKSLC